MNRRNLLIGGAAAALAPSAFAMSPRPPASKLWVFDRLDNIGGVTTHVEGAPKLIDSPQGKAVLFDGVKDALFIDEHPLAGAATFTFEAIFRPDGGAFAQRWFHLASDEPAPAPGEKPLGTRFLFEIRVVGTNWYLDTFVNGKGYKQALMFPEKLHPIGPWYHVAQTYDGKTYRSFVNGVVQGEVDIAFAPQGPGKSSVGTRYTHEDYFHGAIREARFTPRALSPKAFLTLKV